MKIIALGNRYISPDGAALWFYDKAIKQQWNTPIDWIEGGLGGLNLSPHFDTERPILLIDYMPGFKNATQYPLQQVLNNRPTNYDHASALYYLLNALPSLFEKLPRISLMACNPNHTGWMEQLFATINQMTQKPQKLVEV